MRENGWNNIDSTLARDLHVLHLDKKTLYIHGKTHKTISDYFPSESLAEYLFLLLPSTTHSSICILFICEVAFHFLTKGSILAICSRS